MKTAGRSTRHCDFTHVTSNHGPKLREGQKGCEMSDSPPSKAFIESVNSASTHWTTNSCPACGTELKYRDCTFSMMGRLGKSHSQSASSVIPLHMSTRRSMTPNKCKESALIAEDLDVSLLKRTIALWPYAMIVFSLAGFVYRFSSH